MFLSGRSFLQGVAVFLASLACNVVIAQTEIAPETSKLHASNGLEGDQFSDAIAVSEDAQTLVVGAPLAGNRTGLVYVFTMLDGQWTEDAVLSASDATEGDQFGISVAISEGRIVIGADQTDHAGLGSGSAYVFSTSDEGWSEQAILHAGDAAIADRFGNSVAIHSDTIVVGALEDDNDAGFNSGAAYVFMKENDRWEEQAKLVASEAASGDEFGSAVAIQGDTIFVGAHNDDVENRDTGSVHVFRTVDGDWIQNAIISPSDARAGDRLGSAISVHDDVLALGARLNIRRNAETRAVISSGATYIYRLVGDSWQEEAKLITRDTKIRDRTGWSVFTNGRQVLMGSPGQGNGVGAAYLFELTDGTWVETMKYVASDGALGHALGSSVALSGSSAIVGAPGTNALYIFDLP